MPVGSSQAAARNPKTEQTRGAAQQTVANLDEAKEGAEEVKRNEFKGKLKKAIADATPKPTSEDAAEDVMNTGAKKSQSHNA